jgi:hypothetical protein
VVALRNGLRRKQDDLIAYAIELLQMPMRHARTRWLGPAPEGSLDRGRNPDHIAENANLSIAPQLQVSIVTHVRLEQSDRKMGMVSARRVRPPEDRPKGSGLPKSSITVV